MDELWLTEESECWRVRNYGGGTFSPRTESAPSMAETGAPSKTRKRARPGGEDAARGAVKRGRPEPAPPLPPSASLSNTLSDEITTQSEAVQRWKRRIQVRISPMTRPIFRPTPLPSSLSFSFLIFLSSLLPQKKKFLLLPLSNSLSSLPHTFSP